MEKISAAQWMETDTRWKSGDGADGGKYYTQHWLRVHPPAEARHTDYGGSWSHDVIDERGHLHTASTWDNCSLYPRSISSDDLLASVHWPRDTPTENLEDDANDQPQRVNWHHEAVEREGKPLIRWHCRYVVGNFHVEETIWTEPTTRRIVRKEHREVNPVSGKPVVFRVCDRYIYNEEAPAGTFEMPPDKPIDTPDLKITMPEIWDTLSEPDRQAIQKTIHRVDAAWLNSDFSAFASVWEFNGIREIPRKSAWKACMRRQAHTWSCWSSEIQSVNTQDFIPIAVAAHGFLFGRVNYEVLRVRVKLHVGWGRDRGWTGLAELYLRRRRRNRHYRIVHWEVPWEEIRAAMTDTNNID